MKNPVTGFKFFGFVKHLAWQVRKLEAVWQLEVAFENQGIRRAGGGWGPARESLGGEVAEAVI